LNNASASAPTKSGSPKAAPRARRPPTGSARDEIEPFYKEGNAEAGSIESSVAIPMPRSGDGER